MSKPSKYLLLSLPTSIVPSHHRDDALEAVSTTVSPDNGSTTSFPIPEFKIGTLDALVQQADELSKLEASCESVVAKVGDALKNILEDESQIEQMKVVNDSMSPAWYYSVCGRKSITVLEETSLCSRF
jgi:V-type H+-transporting ATPase subunit C